MAPHSKTFFFQPDTSQWRIMVIFSCMEHKFVLSLNNSCPHDWLFLLVTANEKHFTKNETAILFFCTGQVTTELKSPNSLVIITGRVKFTHQAHILYIFVVLFAFFINPVYDKNSQLVFFPYLVFGMKKWRLAPVLEGWHSQQTKLLKL